MWWRHAHGGFGWVGPVFWPYAYYDFYDYAWWGWGYDPFFWDYGYGDLYAGLFGLYDYGALSGYAGYLPGYAGPARWARASRGSEAETSLADMCGSDSRDIGGFPIERFRDAIQPNNEQNAVLDDLANASAGATFEDVVCAGAGTWSSGAPPDSAAVGICAERVAGICSAIASGVAVGVVRSATESDHPPTSRASEWVTSDACSANCTVFAALKTMPIATPPAMPTATVKMTRRFCFEEADAGGENCRFEIGAGASPLPR